MEQFVQPLVIVELGQMMIQTHVIHVTTHANAVSEEIPTLVHLVGLEPTYTEANVSKSAQMVIMPQLMELANYVMETV